MQALVLTGNFNWPGIYWKSGTVSGKQPSKLLECIEDSFLVQAMESLTRGEALLDLVLTNMEELIGEGKMGVGCNLGCSERALAEFPILRGTG